MRAMFTRLVLCGGVFGATLAGACPTFAAAPWFHLASVSRPGNLHAGAARNELQEITMSSEVFLEMEVNKTAVGVFATEPFFALLGGAVPEPTAANVQAALEGAYGTGNVVVRGGPGGTAPLIVESVGEDSGLPVRPVEVVAIEGAANSRAVRAGRPDGQIVVAAANVGDAIADGKSTPVTLSVRLPKGLHPLSIEGVAGQSAAEAATKPVSCELPTLKCSFAGSLPPYSQMEVRVGVAVDASQASSGDSYEAQVSGGGAPLADISHQITVSSAPTPFGAEDYAITPEEEGGIVDAQAGSHSFQTTFTFDLAQTLDEEGNPQPAGGLPKDLSFKLPPGLVGNPTAYPRCTSAQFDSLKNGMNGCPPDSVLGVAMVTFNDPAGLGYNTAALPIFNLVPRVGEPARFGFQPASVPAFIGTSVRTGDDYGVTAHVETITQMISFLSSSVTIWGVPGDPRHASARGYGCLALLAGAQTPPPCEPATSSSAPPFLALPTSCTGPLKTSVLADSWLKPNEILSFDADQFGTPMPALVGCGQLPFSSEIKVVPDVSTASTPTGLTADVHIPQDEALNASGLAPADVKNISVTLPEGLQLNPSAADGLGSCSQEQIGLSSPGESSCPDRSKIATATITTPLLPNPLKGFVYLASPQNFASPPSPLENPFGSLVAMYLVAFDPVSGTRVKLPGRVSLSPSGQVTTTFASNPQLPFEDAEISFFGGERAPLATPARCATYTTRAVFEPWSNTNEHEEVLHSNSTFAITGGANGSACPGAALAFSPSLASESLDVNAGGFTPLSTTLTRDDGQQPLQSVILHYPPGLSGILTGIPLCPEAQANAGTCPVASQIGETTVSVGVGGDPFTVTGGKVYLTEKYQGAPFGLSIVNPAKAGPFTLQEGRPVVVRAKIEIDPTTAALTVTAGPIPTIIEGFPLQVKHVNVLINRPQFTFNPTNCSPTSISGGIDSAEGSTFPVAVPFQVTNCAMLKFAPKFSVSTNARTSKAAGASLSAKVVEPPGALGKQANIALVKVDLPRQLPSRLKTLQKACLASVFEANHAACPSQSIVGHARVTTPLLPVPLTGPAYFVSHGGEAFPSLTLVLQGYGVTVELVGSTFIKNGITSSTFKMLPDVPFNTFELTLPQGPYAALAANLPAKASNFCGQKLVMPTRFVAQNGLELRQSTQIHVNGCASKPRSRLAAALNACRKKRGHARAACESRARKRFGSKKIKKK
jgi:hypothetical protein